MTDLERLAPDQRAVLALVLEQDKSYAQVAEMLGMSERTVRDRAHAALDALARETAVNGDGRPPAGSHPAGFPPAGSPAAARPSLRPTPRASRLGGALLLGAIVAAVIVAVILLTGGGKGSSGQTAAHGTAKTTGAASAAPRIDKTLPLTAVEPSSKAAAVAYVLSQGNRRAFYVRAEGMAPTSLGSFYAVWLYNSPSSAAPLGRAPKVGSNGRMEGGGPLPGNARSYRKIVVTRESDANASHPGEIVLSGAFSLH